MTTEIRDKLIEMSLIQYRRGIGKIAKGHSIFKFNIDTEEVTRVNNNYIFEFGNLYMPALNKHNAEKKIKRVLEYARRTASSFLQAGSDNSQDKM